MVGYAVISLWVLSTLLDLAALISLIRRRIAVKNLGLAVFLALSAAWALVAWRMELVSSQAYRQAWPQVRTWVAAHGIGWVERYIAYDPGRYTRFWYSTSKFAYPLHAILALGAVHRLALCFPGVYALSRLMLIFFGAFAALGLWGSIWLVPQDGSMLGMVLYCARHSEAFWLCFLAAALLFFGQFAGDGGVEPCSNAQSGALIAVAYFAVGFIANTLIAADGWHSLAGHVELQAGVCGCCIAWLVRMTARGEIPPPQSEPSAEELRAAARDEEQLRKRLRDEGILLIDVH